jgi:flagellar M-ring protein FliF
MDKTLEQIRAFLRGLSINQRLMLVGSAVLLGLTVWFFVRLFSAAEYKNLYTGLDPTDTQKIVQRLSMENISFQLSSDGTSIDVPMDKLDRIRVEMASQNLPHTGRLGFELFDKPNWSSSDFSERVNYQRALEAELERTIETMDTVESARVHLVLPHESLFTTEERPAKAAVVVKLRTQRLADETVTSIANLVASAWENLSPDDVTIVSADGRFPLTARKPGDNPARRGMADLETTIAERIIDTLSPVVGADHVKSSVTIEYNPDSGETTQELYDPNASAIVTSQISDDQTTGAAPVGIPGTTSNVPTPPPAKGAAVPAVQAKSTTSQGMHSESKTFVVSKTVHHTLEPAGQVKHMAAAILVDDVVETKDVNGKPQETRRKRTPEEMKQLEDLVRAAIGFNKQRGDELSLQNVSFQVLPIETPAIPTRIQKTLKMVGPWMGMLRYVGIGLLFLLVYALVLRPVKNQVLAALRAIPEKNAQGVLQAVDGSGPADGHVMIAALEGDLQKELSQSSSEVMRTVVLKRHLVEKIKKEPESATRLIQGWVRQT